MTSLVALTGATGFIGGNLTPALLDAGYSLRVLTRRAPPRGGTTKGMEWVRGDLSRESALEGLVEGAGAVIHCAGTVRGASREVFQEVNVQGTRRLAEIAAGQKPPPRFLLLSSLAAREPHLSWYAESKRNAEESLLAAGDAMPKTIFRPTAVHGPGDTEMRPLLEALQKGILPVLGAPDSRITLLHVEDLVRAILLWLETEEPVTGVFELHDGRPGGYDWPGIAGIAARIRGRRVRQIPIPGVLLGSAGAASLYLSRLLGRSPMLTPGKVRELRHPDWRCDNTPLCEALGWEPRIDLAAALREL